MYKMLSNSHTSSGVRTMKKEKEIPAAQELRDQPVPPVKGAVPTQDVLLRPDGAMGRHAVDQYDAVRFLLWL